MSATQTMAAEEIPMGRDPFRDVLSGGMAPAQRNEVVPMGTVSGPASDRAFADIVIAQRVPIKRDYTRIKQDVIGRAKVMGTKAFYEWPVPNRRAGTTTFVRGLTIKGAMMAVNLYGNCRVECIVAQETGTHWTFLSRFSDFETGTSIVRGFRQRKGQSAGNVDAERMQDIAFQIGQSKGIRNVVIAALPDLCDEALEAAMDGFVENVRAKFEPFKKRALEWFAQHNIAIERVVRQVARPVEKWRVQDLAGVISKIQQVNDGMDDADDLWPAEAFNPDTGEVIDTTKTAADPGQGDAGKPATDGDAGKTAATTSKPARQRKPSTTTAPPADQTVSKPAEDAADTKAPATPTKEEGKPPATTAATDNQQQTEPEGEDDFERDEDLDPSDAEEEEESSSHVDDERQRPLGFS